MFTSVSVISSASVLSSLEDIPLTGKELTRLELKVASSYDDGPVSPHPDSNNLIAGLSMCSRFKRNVW